MASSEEINVLSICVDLLDGLEGSIANRITHYLNNKYAETPTITTLPTAKKRGRPAKIKSEIPTQLPKKRGRPAKIKEEPTTPPRRRGRPAKVTTAISAPKKRGRPAKKKRGRPRKG